MTIKLKNNASGFLSSAISALDTLLVLQPGQGNAFPTLSSRQFFYVTLASPAGAIEIVKVTARSGDSLTVVRAQEGTNAMAFPALSRVEMRINAQAIYDVIDDAISSTDLAISNIASVIAVASSIDNVNNVAGNMPDVLNVSANTTNIARVSNNVNKVIAVGEKIADVNTVANNMTAINNVADDIDTIVKNIEDITAVGGSITSVVTTANNLANVKTAAANITSINTVAANVADVTNFSDVYYGPKTSNPSARNDGTPRQIGDLYFNTVSGRMRAFDGSLWVDYEATAKAAAAAAQDAQTAAGAARTAAETAQANAKTAETNAKTAETNAEAAEASALAHKRGAEAARDAAVAGAATVYVDTTAGLAATTNGQFFSVPSTVNTEFLTLYKNNSGVAEALQTYPSVNIVQQVLDYFVNLSGDNAVEFRDRRGAYSVAITKLGEFLAKRGFFHYLRINELVIDTDNDLVQSGDNLLEIKDRRSVYSVAITKLGEFLAKRGFFHYLRINELVIDADNDLVQSGDNLLEIKGPLGYTVFRLKKDGTIQMRPLEDLQDQIDVLRAQVGAGTNVATLTRQAWAALAFATEVNGSVNVIGDSISVGVGASNPATTSWWGRLKSAILGANGENLGGSTSVPRLTFYNNAVSGVTSSYFNDNTRLSAITTQGGVGLYIVALGTNNIYNPGAHTLPSVYESDLNTIVTYLQAASSANRVMIVVPPVANEATWVPYQHHSKYAAAARRVARAKGCLLCDDCGVEMVTSGRYADGVHPNDAGHEALFLNRLKAITNL